MSYFNQNSAVGHALAKAQENALEHQRLSAEVEDKAADGALEREYANIQLAEYKGYSKMADSIASNF